MSLSEDQFINSIKEWLDSAPSPATVLEYLKKIPEQKYDLVVYAGDQEFQKLLGQKRDVFAEFKLESTLGNLNEFEQLACIALIASEGLEVARKDPLMVPCADLLTEPFADWCTHYIARWNSTIILVTAPEYLRESLLTESLLKSVGTTDELENHRQNFEDIFRQDGTMFEEGKPLSLADKAKHKEAFMALNFLPEQMVDELLENPDQDEKTDLVSRLLRVILLVQKLDLEKVKESPRLAFLSVWRQLIIEKERLVVATAEGVRVAETAQTTPYDAVLRWLEEQFSYKGVVEGTFSKNLTAYINPLSREQRKFFEEIFQIFLAEAPLFEVAAPEFELDLLAKNIADCTDYAQLGDLITILKQDLESEELQKTCEMVIKAVYAVFQQLHALPAAQSPTAPRSTTQPAV